MVLYRKYRPQQFSDLVGQEEIVKTLLAQLESGKVGHGYLFAGPRGTGKTSTARILAKAVNCEEYSSNVKRKTSNVYGEPCNKCLACRAITDGSYLDLIEIDAASNRGIDEIRDLREKIKLSPVVGNFKVYIIDEVHMLTTEAFNALLKTLEEPPAHAIFVLCTTEQHKLPETILSRLARFSFKRAKDADLSGAISKIAKVEKIKLGVGTAAVIASAADGSYRDALALLDQLAAKGEEITPADVKNLAKVGGENLTFEFIDLLFKKELKKLVERLDEVAGTIDFTAFNRELILTLEGILKFKIGVRREGELGKWENYKEIISGASFADVHGLMRLLLVLEGDMRLYPLPETAMLVAICKWCGDCEVKEKSQSVKSEEVGGVSDVVKVEKVIEVKKIEKEQDPEATEAAEVVDEKGKVEIKVETVPLKKKKSSGSSVTLAQIESGWNEFLNRIRPVNAHVVALLKSTRPTEINDDTLVLEVFFRFHKDKLSERKIMDLLCLTMSDIIGSPINLELRLAQRSTKPTSAVVKSDVLEIGGDDLSKMAEEIFLK